VPADRQIRGPGSTEGTFKRTACADTSFTIEKVLRGFLPTKEARRLFLSFLSFLFLLGRGGDSGRRTRGKHSHSAPTGPPCSARERARTKDYGIADRPDEEQRSGVKQEGRELSTEGAVANRGLRPFRALDADLDVGPRRFPPETGCRCILATMLGGRILPASSSQETPAGRGRAAGLARTSGRKYDGGARSGRLERGGVSYEGLGQASFFTNRIKLGRSTKNRGGEAEAGPVPMTAASSLAPRAEWRSAKGLRAAE